ncbi:alanine racemase [Eubacterium sp. AM46-8]|jgi:diaminopimelate decarboxylase|uniref:diaminopimelate decarboxylase family protein n=1 Tax=Eubacterium sp. AM46-8 TaxID=2292350 RepID=UPI000E53615C|nr:alanine racemase [Eubacterium sp. AM46-8]RGZ91515.1 diaminopimelate decarboxylase [Eubacterium sp. AM46-8]
MLGVNELKEIAIKCGTPSYIFDTDELCARIDAIQQILGCGVTVCYAMKANPFLISVLDKKLDKFEVCSPGEFAICEKEGINREKIVLSGVNKEKKDILYTMKTGAVGIYTVESLNQLELINSCAVECGIKVKVLIRVTSGNQFGINERQVYEIADRKDELKGIIIEGIQCYSGTQKKKLSQIESEVVWLQAIAHTCEAEHGVKLNEIEYGPGLSVDYFVTDKCDAMNTDFDELKEFAAMIKEMSEKFNVTLEMGRYIAATCGVLISRIADMKMNDTTRYAIIDSGINHINYYGQAMAMKKPRCEFIPMEYTEEFADGVDHDVEVYSQGVQPYNICGSLCTVGDVIVKNLELKDAKIGDMIAFYNIGAYSVTEGIYLFLSRRMPAIVMYSTKNGYRVIRKSVETFLINSSDTQ